MPAEERAEELREHEEQAEMQAVFGDLPMAGQLDQFLRVWLATGEIYHFDPEEIYAAERHIATFKERANARASSLGELLPFPDTDPP